MYSDDIALDSAIRSLEDDIRTSPGKILLVRSDVDVDSSCSEFWKKCDSEKIKGILEYIAYVAKYPTGRSGREGNTALHLVALRSSSGKWDLPTWGTVAEILIEHGSDVNARNIDGCTPLHLILQRSFSPSHGHAVIDVLLKHGSDVTAVNLDGDTPLHLYPQNSSKFDGSSLDIQTPYPSLYAGFVHLESFVKRARDVNVINSKGETLLHLLVRDTDYSRCCRSIQLLLDYGADVGRRGKSGENAYEAYCRTVEKLKRTADPRFLILLQSNEQRLKNSSALHVASLFHNHDSVRELLRLGADVNAVDNFGYSPLAYALIRTGRDDKASTLRLLLDYGADMHHQITIVTSRVAYGRNKSLKDLELCRCRYTHGPRHTYCAYPIFDQHNIKLSVLHGKEKEIKVTPNEGEDENWYQHFRDWLSRCSEELNAMRESKVGESSSITFLDLLNASAKETAIYAKNKVMVEAFHAGKGRFPMYQGMLDAKLARELARRKLIERATVFLSDALGFADPSDEFYERTLSHCSNNDLMRMVDGLDEM